MNFEINVFNFLRDSLLIILSWILLACAFHSWGNFLAKIIGIKLNGNKKHFANIWLGWCFCLFFFAVYHLLFPINAFASSIFYGPAIVYFFIKYHKKIIPFIKSIDKLKLTAIFLATFAIAAVAIQLPMNFDTGLYHLNSIRWANEHHIVKGLGNLHTRLGFNQLYFLYCASLNFHPFLNAYGFHAANTFLYFAFCLGCLVSGTAVDLILTILFFFLPVPYFWVVSPTTDVASCFLQIIAFRVFLDALLGDKLSASGDNEANPERWSLIALAAILSAVLVTVKLSNVVFALGLGLITIIIARKHTFEAIDKKIIKKAFIFIGVFVALWLARGYIQTGYPVFPSSIGRISFDWTVPERLAKYTETYVYAGSRTDGLITNFDSPVLQNGGWVDAWFKEFFFNDQQHLTDDPVQNFFTIFLLIVFPMTMYSWGMGCLTLFVLSIVLLVIWLCALVRQKSSLWKKSSLLFYLFLVSVAGIVFWILVAPEPRFANAIFICEFITCLLMVKAAYPKLILTSGIKKAMMFYTVVILIWCFDIGYSSDEFRIDGMMALHGVPVKEFVTKSGLVLLKPTLNNQTWDTGLLATPEPEPGLELRGETIADGFRIKE